MDGVTSHVGARSASGSSPMRSKDAEGKTSELHSASHSHSSSAQSMSVLLEVGGQKFQIEDPVVLFGKYPDTMLGRMFAPENRDIFISGRASFTFPDRSPAVFEAVIRVYAEDVLEIVKGMSARTFWSELAFWQVKPPLPLTIGGMAARDKHMDMAERAAQGAFEALASQIDIYASFVSMDPSVQILFVAYLSPISNVVATSDVLRFVDDILETELKDEVNTSESFEAALRRLEERVKFRFSPVFRRISLLPKLSVVLGTQTQRATHAETISSCIKCTIDYLELSNVLAHSKFAQLLLQQKLATVDLQAVFDVLHSSGGQVLPVFSGIGDIQCTWQWVSSELPVFNWVFDGDPGKDHTRRLVVRATPIDTQLGATIEGSKPV